MIIMADEQEEEMDGDNIDGDMDADEPAGSGGMEEETKGPRDEIKVTVQSFQKTASDSTYEIQVGSRRGCKVFGA